MIEVRQTEQFQDWLAKLRDHVAAKAIRRRIARVQIGLLGDAKAVGDGVHELRIDHGPGYRVYFARRGQVVVLLLSGGIKAGQDRDIARAKALAAEWTE
ncbi:MAG: type II toxin-antitoxin system RelE/ParE family toxin [Sphingomonadaceae bacterium]